MVADLHSKLERKGEESNFEESMYRSILPVKILVNPSAISLNPFNLNSIPLYHDQQK